MRSVIGPPIREDGGRGKEANGLAVGRNGAGRGPKQLEISEHLKTEIGIRELPSESFFLGAEGCPVQKPRLLLH